MTDHHTKQRIKWIDSVSPFHKDESRLSYIIIWGLCLIFGGKMPHESR